MPDPDDAARAEAVALEHACDVLIAHVEGLLRFDDQGITLRYVVDPHDGRLVASVPVAVFMAAEHVLFVPEETDDALQVLVSVEEAPDSACTDRWQMYHGTPEHVRWASFWLDGARHGPWVFDGEALCAPNAALSEEAALCRLANQDRGRLARLCQRFGGVVVPDPVCVGVDPRGVHVRARFGVVRVRFEPRATDGPGARAALEAMLAAV